MTRHRRKLIPRLIPPLLVAVLMVLTWPGTAFSQTAATATILGTVTDPTGAVLPGAEVELLNTATSQSRKQITNEAGQYVFTYVLPGPYKITVTAQGFRQAVIPLVKVDVAKSYTVNVTLEVGEMVETVEVTAGVGVELQTTDSTVGDVIGGEPLLRLPTTNRSAAALLLLQPLVTPGRGVSTLQGGQVSGALSDQSTFLIDGGDATSDVEGTAGYNTGQSGQPLPMIPVPVESIEEFRVSTTNPNATFGRSSGGQVAFVTKRGTNEIHGSAYWYHQNDNLNANRWDFNRTGIEKPELIDNRFGFSLGGPLIKDKLFLFGNYEGRRFPRKTSVTRIVPMDTLRQGILRFRDASGNIVSYDLATSTLCGDGTHPCDPRGVGISPVVRALWNLLPPGNDPALGDGLNTIGFRAAADNTLKADFFVTRLDYNITDTWNFFASFRYARTDEPDPRQLDIAGLISGQPGKAVPVAGSPLQPRYLVWGVTGQINPRLTNDFRFSWYRHWWEWQRSSPFPQVPGTAAALQLAGEPGLVDEPINIDTQRARSRVWNGRDKYVADNVTWITGNHTIQFGGSYRRQDIFHQRDDKVTGLLTSLIYWLDADQGVVVPPDNRPPTCGGDITTNCLSSGDLSRWNSLYAATLGLVDRAAVLVTFDKDFNPKPFGTPLRVNIDVHAVELYAQDIWRMTPSLTFTYGLTWQVQVPPVEEDGLQTLTVFRKSESLLAFDDYIRQRREAALRGEIFNPELGWDTIERTGRKYPYDIDWNNFGPRVAIAWNPSFQGGVLGRLFGDRKSVIRGGYSLTYDRLNGVNLVMAPPITVGFGQSFRCTAPLRPDLGGGCAGVSDPSTGFRIGVDGASVPLPPVTPVSEPIVPSAPFGEGISSQLDVHFTLGEHHSLNLTIQRELPGNMLLEVGWVARLGRNLQLRTDINSVPWFFLDPASGQTLAEAFDAVAEQLRAGIDPSSVTPQPWFENQLGGAATCMADPACSAAGSWTALLATNRTTDFVNGRLSRVMMNPGGVDRIGQGAIGLAGAFDNLQVRRDRIIVDGARSNYHAAFISLRKRFSSGLSFGVNYTFSHALDQQGRNQQFSATNVSAFNFDFDYGPALFDRRHMFNAYWYYELPVGRGRAFSPQSPALEKFLGGWFLSGIFDASSGLPLCVSTGNGVFGGGLGSVSSCAIPIRKPDFGNSVHKGVTGSGGIGTTGDVNLFADPEAVFRNFRRILISKDGRSARGALRGLPRWNLDLSLGKKTPVTETVNVLFSFDFINVFNHMEFDDPSTSLLSPQSFGVLRSQFNEPRRIQFGLRVEF